MRNVGFLTALIWLVLGGGSAFAAAPTVMEAETTSTSTGLTYVRSDSAASGQSYLKLANNGTTSFTYSGSRSLLTVRAKPEDCGGGPEMTVAVTNSSGTTTLASLILTSTSWSQYQYALPTSTSTTVKISFTNDGTAPDSCARNLWLDAIAVSDRQATGTAGSNLTLNPTSMGWTEGSTAIIDSPGTANLVSAEPVSSIDVDVSTLNACAGPASLRVSVDGAAVDTAEVYWLSAATRRINLPAPLWAEPHTISVELANPTAFPTIQECGGRILRVSAVRLNSSVMTAPPAIPGAASVVSMDAHRGYASQIVEITGRNLVSATKVRFGSTEAPIVGQASFGNGYDYLDVRVPAGTLGARADVTVESPHGNSTAVTAAQWTYIGRPTITSLAPAQGPTAGGTKVIATGTNLDGVTSAKFGTATAAVNLATSTPTTVELTAPAGSGVVDVTVTSGVLALTSAANTGDRYTYLAPTPAPTPIPTPTPTPSTLPTVTALSPASGSQVGDTVVTIAGTNLGSATTVKFGATSATILSKASTKLVVASPAGAVGAADVRVTSSAGTSANTSADNYTYVAKAAGTLWFAPRYYAPTTNLVNPTATLYAWRDEHEPDGSAYDDRVQIVTGGAVPSGANQPFGALQTTNKKNDVTILNDGLQHPRAEALTQYHKWVKNQVAWVDYWFYVPSGPSFKNLTESGAYSTIFQWKGGYSSPLLALEIDRIDEHLKFRSNWVNKEWAIGALTRNRWIHLTFGVKFSPTTSGQVWYSLDGAPLQTFTTKTIGDDGSSNAEVYPKQGLYQSKSEVGKDDRTIFAGPIRIADTQALAQQR